MNTYAERINYLIDILHNGNRSAFSRSVEVDPNTIRFYTEGRSPKGFAITKIIENTPNLNAHWFCTGKEKPFPEKRTETQAENEKEMSFLYDRLKDKDDLIESLKQQVELLKSNRQG